MVWFRITPLLILFPILFLGCSKCVPQTNITKFNKEDMVEINITNLDTNYSTSFPKAIDYNDSYSIVSDDEMGYLYIRVASLIERLKKRDRLLRLFKMRESFMK